MTLKLRGFGEIQISKIQHLDLDEYEVLDVYELSKIAGKTWGPIKSAYISENENDYFLVIYLEIPEDLLQFSDDVAVFPIENPEVLTG